MQCSPVAKAGLPELGLWTLMLTQDLLHALPKTDLHVHLDGSLRIESLIEMARERGVILPSNSPDGLRELVFKPSYSSLSEYLTGFALTGAVLQDPEALERSAYELALDNLGENVCYIEVRFAPQLHMSGKMSMERVVRAVASGLERAKQEHASKPEVMDGTLPPFHFGLILCAMRMFEPGFTQLARSPALDRVRVAIMTVPVPGQFRRDARDEGGTWDHTWVVCIPAWLWVEGIHKVRE